MPREQELTRYMNGLAATKRPRAVGSQRMPQYGTRGLGAVTMTFPQVIAAFPPAIRKIYDEGFTTGRIDAITDAMSAADAQVIADKLSAIVQQRVAANMRIGMALAYDPATVNNRDLMDSWKDYYFKQITRDMEAARIAQATAEAKRAAEIAATASSPVPTAITSPAALEMATMMELSGKLYALCDQADGAMRAGQPVVSANFFESAKAQAALVIASGNKVIEFAKASQAANALWWRADEIHRVKAERIIATDIPALFVRTQANLAMGETKAGSSPTVTEIEVARTKARFSRSIVQAQTNDWAAIYAELRDGIYNPGMIFKSDTGVYSVIAFEGACSSENLKRIGIKPDIYVRCQIALQQLCAPGVSPDTWNWAQPKKDPIRDEMGKAAADWLQCVYNWVSLAFFCANVEPGMLFPAYTTQLDNDGEHECTRAFPAQVQTVTNNISIASEDGKWLVDNRRIGPSWMGFYDRECTGWLAGNFAPQHSDHRDTAMRYSTKDDVTTYPTAIREYGPPTTDDMDINTIGRNVIINPWYYWYYAIVSSPDCSEYLQKWSLLDRTAIDDTSHGMCVGPKGMFLLAKAWSNVVTSTTLFDILGPSYDWYTNNHMNYWSARGLIDYPTGEINTIQRAAAAAVVEGRGQTAQQIVGAIGGAMMVVPNPIVQGIGAAITLVGSLVTMGVTKRRAKKAANESKKPLPLTLRTMTDAGCATFGATLSLPEGLANCAAMLIAGDNAAAHTAITSADTTGVLTSQGGQAAISTASAPALVDLPTGSSTITPSPPALVPGPDGQMVAPPQPSPALVTAVAQIQSNLPIPTAMPPAVAPRAQLLPTPVWVGIGAFAAIILVRVATRNS